MITSVAFKNLGIAFDMNRRVISFNALGGGIYWYAVIICVGFLLAYLYISHEEKKTLGNTDTLLDLVLIGIPAGVICARLYFVVFSWNDYADNLVDIVKVWEGGLAIYGGVLGAFLAITIYCNIKKVSLLHYLDLCAMGLLIGQCVGRWGNFVNGEAHGGVCSSSFILGMTVNGEGPFHPTFLYESFFNLIGFCLIMLIAGKIKKDGFRFYCYLVWYGAVRFFIEGLRTDSLYILDTGLRVSQLLSGVLFCVGAVLLTLTIIRRQKND